MITPDEVHCPDVGEASVIMSGTAQTAHKIRVAQLPVTEAEATRHWQHLQEQTSYVPQEEEQQEETTPSNVTLDGTPQDEIE